MSNNGRQSGRARKAVVRLGEFVSETDLTTIDKERTTPGKRGREGVDAEVPGRKPKKQRRLDDRDKGDAGGENSDGGGESGDASGGAIGVDFIAATTKTCAGCRESKLKSEFTRSEWFRVDTGKCKRCANESPGDGKSKPRDLGSLIALHGGLVAGGAASDADAAAAVAADATV
eukprot:c15811_g1_i1.p3 GENE.c15811_g1_i1~~c15811_g1_i1.p3  ORF type:complete len:174 (-),score=19.32 c15811_g1_i1:4-525(-)